MGEWQPGARDRAESETLPDIHGDAERRLAAGRADHQQRRAHAECQGSQADPNTHLSKAFVNGYLKPYPETAIGHEDATAKPDAHRDTDCIADQHANADPHWLAKCHSPLHGDAESDIDEHGDAHADAYPVADKDRIRDGNGDADFNRQSYAETTHSNPNVVAYTNLDYNCTAIGYTYPNTNFDSDSYRNTHGDGHVDAIGNPDSDSDAHFHA
jgi:hypothetical protein